MKVMMCLLKAVRLGHIITTTKQLQQKNLQRTRCVSVVRFTKLYILSSSCKKSFDETKQHI